ncbi:MAG: tRNA lysidine(34) synthetase TilS [Novosphingobium sp.]
MRRPAAMPERIAAATVDHGLRAEAPSEAAMVARLCGELGVPHATLRVTVGEGNVQSNARAARYAALADWMERDGLGALATAHHADDQAETLLMRLNRGSGVPGLPVVRAWLCVPGTRLALLRPLLGWRREDLARIVSDAGIVAAQDPSNSDDRFDRHGCARNWQVPTGLTARPLRKARPTSPMPTPRSNGQRRANGPSGSRRHRWD